MLGYWQLQIINNPFFVRKNIKEKIQNHKMQKTIS